LSLRGGTTKQSHGLVFIERFCDCRAPLCYVSAIAHAKSERNDRLKSGMFPFVCPGEVFFFLLLRDRLHTTPASISGLSASQVAQGNFVCPGDVFFLPLRTLVSEISKKPGFSITQHGDYEFNDENRVSLEDEKS
jgi:hypothetical protein